MEINVIEDDMLMNIRSAFQEQYPYLTLRFYRKPHSEGAACPECERIAADKPLEEVTMFHTGGKINIDPEKTVAALEHDFFETLGLCVQVFRQSGPLWLETTRTDHLTLQQQNDTGRESCRISITERPEDFDLQDFS